jgi:hypothetical protein
MVHTSMTEVAAAIHNHFTFVCYHSFSGRAVGREESGMPQLYGENNGNAAKGYLYYGLHVYNLV